VYARKDAENLASLNEVEDLMSRGESGSLLSVSHLCGDHRCGNPDHVIVEGKRTNDERSHCHFVLRFRLDQWEADNPRPSSKRKLKAWREKRYEFIASWIYENCSHGARGLEYCCCPPGW